MLSILAMTPSGVLVDLSRFDAVRPLVPNENGWLVVAEKIGDIVSREDKLTALTGFTGANAQRQALEEITKIAQALEAGKPIIFLGGESETKFLSENRPKPEKIVLELGSWVTADILEEIEALVGSRISAATGERHTLTIYLNKE